MKLMLIGGMGVGKDTAANFLRYTLGFDTYTIADRLREICYDIFPVQMQDAINRRHIMQRVGDSFRSIDEAVFCNYIWQRIKDSSELNGIINLLGRKKYEPNVVITDVRLKFEYNFFKERGFTSIKIHANDETIDRNLAKRDKNYDPSSRRHRTETEISSIPGDWTIENNGTLEEFYRHLERTVKGIENSARR